jgi:hypothetical protein
VTRLGRAALMAAMALATSGLMASGQGRAGAEKPEVLPGIWVFSGGAGAGTSSSLAFGDDAWQEMVLWAGGPGADICTAGTTSPRPGPVDVPESAEGRVVTWRVAFRRQAFDGFTATLDVRWSRQVRAGANIEPGSDFEGAFTWRASEGDSRVLDLVRQVPAARPACDAQSITLEYKAIGPEELREASLGYDLWLVQRLPTGGTDSRRLQASGRQADSVRFAFPAVALDGSTSGAEPGNTDPKKTVEVSVEGRIRGRVRRDGRLDISVDAGRAVGPREGLRSGSSGRTHLTVMPGETIELEPPPLSGTGPDGSYAELVKDAPTTIRVRARRLW